MTKLLDIIGATASKYGLFPSIALLALLLGGYGFWQAKDNELAIQQLAIEQARTDSKLDANTKELSANLQRVDKTLIELTTQIKLLVDGKLQVGGNIRWLLEGKEEK